MPVRRLREDGPATFPLAKAPSISQPMDQIRCGGALQPFQDEKFFTLLASFCPRVFYELDYSLC